MRNKKITDGNIACAEVMYKLTDYASIYPITPSTTMAERYDELIKNGEKNNFGKVNSLIEMQSEAGSAAALHGLAAAGKFGTTFTCSQGLLLMIPTLYKLVGEHLPAVINVSARAISQTALSIFGEHGDIYATSGTGCLMLASSSVQEAQDMAAVACLLSLKTRLPIIHFFDGFKTSHEYNIIEKLTDEELLKFADYKMYEEFYERQKFKPEIIGLNVEGQRFTEQKQVTAKLYENVYEKLEEIFKSFESITGRNYKPYEYYGNANAKKVVVIMGSGAQTFKSIAMNIRKDIGVVNVKLFNPFNYAEFVKVLPKTVQEVVVLDNAKEEGKEEQQLAQNVISALFKAGRKIKVTSKVFGLGGADFNLEDALECLNEEIEPLSRSVADFEGVVYARGSEGAVLASKMLLRVIAETELFASGNFKYDSKKSGNRTECHLRVSRSEILAPYYIKKPMLNIRAEDTNIYEVAEKYKLKQRIGGLLAYAFAKTLDEKFNMQISLKFKDVYSKKFGEVYAAAMNEIKFTNNNKQNTETIACVDKVKCIGCNLCSLYCPHAAIRPSMFKGENKAEVVADFCTSCGICAEVCPVNAITIGKKSVKPEIKLIEKEITPEELNIKTSQFLKPYFSCSSACGGCGETPYLKLLGQLFGSSIVIANATGCSSIYGGDEKKCPYIKDERGEGISWHSSLFEDNAEFGLGMYLAYKQKREEIRTCLEGYKKEKAVVEYLNNFDDIAKTRKLAPNILQFAIKNRLNEVIRNSDAIAKKTFWIVGGDGWAYDIGFGGVDHIMSLGEDINILVLDTETYSNTGGQTSKASGKGSKNKFSLSGKQTEKKNLAEMMTAYKNVFVFKISLGANPSHALNSFVEAEKHKGASLIVAYSPCIEHKYDLKYAVEHQRMAEEAGYLKLFTYNPKNKKPLEIVSPKPTRKLSDFFKTEGRF